MAWWRGHMFGLAAVLAAVACARPPLTTKDAGAGGSGGSPSVGSPGGASGATGVGGGQSCARYVFPPPIPALDVLILLDASGSMAEDQSGTVCSSGCTAKSKWELATTAIDQLTVHTDWQISWGLAWFPTTGFCGVTMPAVPVGLENYSTIGGVVGQVFPGGSTPTRAAEAMAAAYLAGLPTDARKLILLVTDGASNCLPGSTNTTTDDTPAAIDAIASAAAQGFPTIVLGVTAAGGSADPALDQMAAAGGLPRAGSPAYYPLSGTADILATLFALMPTKPSCIFPLPTEPTNDGTTTYPQFVVSVDGMPVPFDTTHTNGWDYTAPLSMRIQLYGPPCDSIQVNPPAHTIALDFFCPGD